jgi:hypothetical protein
MHCLRPALKRSRNGGVREICASIFTDSMGGNLQLDQLRGEMKRSSPQSIAENTEEMKEWEDELERLQKLVPIQASRDRLKRNELPALEKQIKEQEAAIPAISKKAEEVRWFAVHFVVSL